MWIRPEFLRAARMPSTRSQPLNPRLVASRPAAASAVRTAPLAPPQAAERDSGTDDAVEQAAEAARAGGFHESSYELRSGLDVDESEWPDTTIPGALADR